MAGAEFLALVVVALASYRAQRVVTADTISGPFRKWVWHRAYERDGYNPDGVQPRVVRRSRIWEKAYQLVDCPFCFGFWTSLAAWWLWFRSGQAWAHTALLVLAIAGMQAFIASRDNA